MTDKEFKRLSRPQLIDIIYQLQIEERKLTEENAKLKDELADKRTHLRQAGNIAEASLAIHNVMEAAQNAAEQYLAEIRIMRAETEEQCQRLLEKAQNEADAIIAHARKVNPSYDSDLEAIMKEFGPK